MLHFVDKSSFVTQADTYSLSIQANLNGFSFCVTTPAGACVALADYTYSDSAITYDDLAGELFSIFEKEPLLQKKYATTQCMYISNKAMLIPEALFDKEQLRVCLERVVALDELDEIHFRKTEATDVVTAFAVPSPLAGIIVQHHPDATFFHQSIPLSHYLSRQTERQRAMLYIEGNLATIVLFRNNQMVLSNTFRIEAFNDALYYLMFAVKEFEIDPAFLFLSVAGVAGDTDKETLKKYYPMANFVGGKVPLLVGQIAAIRYQPLLMLHKCE